MFVNDGEWRGVFSVKWWQIYSKLFYLFRNLIGIYQNIIKFIQLFVLLINEINYFEYLYKFFQEFWRRKFTNNYVNLLNFFLNG